MPPTSYIQTSLQTVTDAAGGNDQFLAEIWNRGDFSTMRKCVIGVTPASASGYVSFTGQSITAANLGMPLPAGGLYIEIKSQQDVRNFRIQASTGGTIQFVAIAWRRG